MVEIIYGDTDEAPMLAKTPEDNIIKLHNISDSVPQLVAAKIPDFNPNPVTDQERRSKLAMLKFLLLVTTLC